MFAAVKIFMNVKHGEVFAKAETLPLLATKY